jgi:predicted MFS family arabinose efflux permease
VTDRTARRLTNPWLVLALLLGIALLNFADRYLLSGLVQPIKTEFALSDGFMGLLLGPAFALLYALFAIPIARVADRTSRIAVLAAGCGMWSLFTALTAYAHNGTTLAIARIGVGIGEAAYQAPSAGLIAAYFAPQQRGRALALVSTSIYIGQILGMVGGPAIAAQHGWRAAFEMLGVAGIAVAATAFLIIREPPRADEEAQGETSLMTLARVLVGSASMRGMTFALAFGTLSGVTFGMWGPALFQRAYGLTTAEAGTMFGLSFGLPGLVGMLGFGVLADRMARSGMHRPLNLAAGALAAATACVILATWMPSVGLAKLVAIPSGLLGGGWSVGIVASLQYMLPDRFRTTGTALALLVMSMFGNLFGPWLTGMVSDHFVGEGAHGLRFGLTLLVPTGFIGAWLAWRAGLTLEVDRERLAQA